MRTTHGHELILPSFSRFREFDSEVDVEKNHAFSFFSRVVDICGVASFSRNCHLREGADGPARRDASKGGPRPVSRCALEQRRGPATRRAPVKNQVLENQVLDA